MILKRSAAKASNYGGYGGYGSRYGRYGYGGGAASTTNMTFYKLREDGKTQDTSKPFTMTVEDDGRIKCVVSGQTLKGQCYFDRIEWEQNAILSTMYRMPNVEQDVKSDYCSAFARRLYIQRHHLWDQFAAIKSPPKPKPVGTTAAATQQSAEKDKE
eukprot:UN28600